MSRVPGGRNGNDYRGLAIAGTAVMELVAPILVGVWVDQKFGWAPWGLACGAVLGFVGGISHLLVIANRTDGPKSGGNGGGSRT